MALDPDAASSETSGETPTETQPETQAETPGLLAPLRRPKLRRMFTAQFIAELGDGISLVALPLYVWARTESEVLTSLTFAAELSLGIVLAFIGGMLADAFDRQRVLQASQLLRAILLVGAFAIDPLLAAVTCGVLARAAGMADNPSFDAMVPSHAEGDLQQVLALRRIVQSASITIGPGLGGLAVAVIGPRTSLLLNAGTFLVAFALLSTVRNADPDAAGRRASQIGQSFAESAGELRKGMAVVLRTPGVRRLIVHVVIQMATVGLVMASAVVFYESELQAPDYWFGLAIAGYGTGSVVGLAFIGGRRFSIPLPRLILIATPAYAVACAIGGLVDRPEILAISWFVWGVAFAPEQLLAETFFVERIDETERGRAFAGLNVAISLGMAVGSLIAAAALDSFSARTVILAAGVTIILSGAVWLGPSRQGAAWPDA